MSELRNQTILERLAEVRFSTTIPADKRTKDFIVALQLAKRFGRLGQPDGFRESSLETAVFHVPLSIAGQNVRFEWTPIRGQTSDKGVTKPTSFRCRLRKTQKTTMSEAHPTER